MSDKPLKGILESFVAYYKNLKAKAQQVEDMRIQQEDLAVSAKSAAEAESLRLKELIGAIRGSKGSLQRSIDDSSA